MSEEIHWITSKGKTAKDEFLPALYMVYKKLGHFFPHILLTNCLKFVSTIFFKFLFFHQMIALQKLWKIFFLSSKKLFLFSRYSNFCNFPPSFPNFPDSKGQMEVE